MVSIWIDFILKHRKQPAADWNFHNLGRKADSFGRQSGGTSGHHLAIEALQKLPANTRLVIIGKGNEQSRLEALARQLGVADRVHFAGVILPDQLMWWYSAADALVLCSSREGWPNVVLEANGLRYASGCHPSRWRDGDTHTGGRRAHGRPFQRGTYLGTGAVVRCST